MMAVKNWPIFERIWSMLRERKIIRKHKQVGRFWRGIISEYYKGNIKKWDSTAKDNLSNEKIIWQYWGQGFDENSLPEVVKICLQSVDKNQGNWRIIRIDNSNYHQYVDFPDFVLDKLNNNNFNYTFFSDLLRLALLKNYGGIWLDATIFLSDKIADDLLQGEYFMFQRDQEEVNTNFWKRSYAYYWNWNSDFKVNVLNSIFYSKKNSHVINVLYDLMLHYWESQNEVIDYFFFQILYDELIKHELSDYQCVVKSDVVPHLLQTRLNAETAVFSYDSILEKCTTHKMSYFNDKAMIKFKEFITNYNLLP